MPSFPHSNRSSIAAVGFALWLCGCSDSIQSNASLQFGSRYTVSFPASPSCAREEVDVPGGKSQREICSYFEESEGHGYSAEIANLPAGGINPPADEVLLAAATGAASSTDSIIANKTFTKVGDFDALDVMLFPRTKGYVAFSRYILVKNELFTFTADGYKTRVIPSDASSFLLSAHVSP
jgi:hypothetical protein